MDGVRNTNASSLPYPLAAGRPFWQNSAALELDGKMASVFAPTAVIVAVTHAHPGPSFALHRASSSHRVATAGAPFEEDLASASTSSGDYDRDVSQSAASPLSRRLRHAVR